MKNKKYFLGIATLLFLVACGEGVSSVAPTTSSEDETSTVGDTTSSVEESSSSETKATLNLNSLKEGYHIKGSYFSTYVESNTEEPKYDLEKPTLYETIIGSDVASFRNYKGYSWEEAKSSGFAQYQKNDNGKPVSVAYDLLGNVIETSMQFKDFVTNSIDLDLTYEEVGLQNAFTSFDIEDFTLTNDETYSLNIKEINEGSNTDKMNALTSLSSQMYLALNGSSYGGNYFMEKDLESFEIAIDNEGNPISFEGSYVKSESWGSYKCQYVTGTFEEMNENTISKLSNIEHRIESLDEAISKLDADNYEFNVTATTSSWASDNAVFSYKLNGKADGSNFEITKTSYNYAGVENGTTTIGYKQNSDSYRKYSITNDVATFDSANSTEGSATSLLTDFAKINSSLFEEVDIGFENVKLYKFVKPELFVGMTSADLFGKFGVDATPTYPGFIEFFVVVSTESIVFKNVNGKYTQTYEFSNIGGVSSINTTINEPVSE